MARTQQERARDEARVEQALLGNLLPATDRRIHTKVAGVTHVNADGSSRQDAIAKMGQFELLALVRNPADPHDENAIRVYCTSPRIQVGHLPAEIARELAPLLDSNEPWGAIVTWLNHGGVGLMLFRRTK